MSGVNTVKVSEGQQILNTTESSPADTIQIRYAKMQLALGEASKVSAKSEMDTIKESQKKQKETSDFLQEARKQQSLARKKKEKDKKATTPMSQKMFNYMKENNLKFNGNTNQKPDEWDLVITSLQARLEQLGSGTQQKMVLLNDYMGQYNSYTQGANTSISQATQVLAALVKG